MEIQIPANHSLAPLNQTAAVLMAAAVTELFPGALMLSGQGTPLRFFYDFFFPFAFQADFLPLIEERMRQMIREKRSLRCIEMMPSNAASMMRHRSQELAADILDGVNRATLEMCQIGEFIAYSPFPCLEELSIPFIKLLEAFPICQRGEKMIRVVGAAGRDKDLLKKISKEASVSSRSHLLLACQGKMLEPLQEEGFWLWRQRGEAVRRQLIQFWEEEHVKQDFEFISSPAAWMGDGKACSLTSLTNAHLEYFLRSQDLLKGESLGSRRMAEIALIPNLDYSDPTLGLFSPKAHFVDLAHLFCSDEKLLEECISSLQFICNIPKILGFEFEIVLSVSSEGTQKVRARAVSLFRQALDVKRIDYRVENRFCPGILASIDIRIADALGRSWDGPCLRIPKAPMPVGRGSLLIRSAFGSLERIVALILEQKEGWLPLWIAPEQIRILVATPESFPYAKQVREGLQAQGFRVKLESGEEPLKTRVYRAVAEKVPYLILLGKREEMAKILTIRAYGKNKEQSLSLDEFCMRLKSEMRSYTSELTN